MSVKGCFHGTRERFAKAANVENLNSHFRLQKFAKHARGFRMRPQLLAGVVFSSLGIFLKFEKFCEHFPHPGPWFACDLFSKKSKKLRHMCTIYSRRAWCLQNLCETPSRFRQFGECFAHVSRKQRSSSDNFLTCIPERLLIHLPFATINLRMTQSISKLFASYTRTKHASAGL